MNGGKALGAIIFGALIIGFGGFAIFATVEKVTHKILPTVEPGDNSAISGDQKGGGSPAWPDESRQTVDIAACKAACTTPACDFECATGSKD